MTSPFDLIKHLSEKTSLEYDIKDYQPWMINKGFSNVLTSIFFAELMNQYSHLDKDIQRDFYFYGLSKGKRFGAWNKRNINTDVELIMQYYSVNTKVAESYLKLMTDADIIQLRESMIKGGSK